MSEEQSPTNDNIVFLPSVRSTHNKSVTST